MNLILITGPKVAHATAMAPTIFVKFNMQGVSGATNRSRENSFLENLPKTNTEQSSVFVFGGT